MKLHTLKPAEGSTKNRKRIGRGQGSGRGGTSTRGHKGAKSRSGYKSKLGFEGGQMPLQRRVPKFGFKNVNRIEYQIINLVDLQILVDKLNTDTISLETFIENGLMSKKDVVKVLGTGELTSKINVSAHKFSASAEEAIQKVGGTVNKL
jgi:large subunit ribosomal protein L15